MSHLRAALPLALFALASQAYAQNNCYTDVNGNYQCDGYGLNYGQRAGIGIAILVLISLLLVSLLFARRRRMQRWQAANTQPAVPHTGYFGGPNYYQQQQQQPQPQPGQFYESQNPNYNYGPDASGWQAPPPVYEPSKDGKGAPNYAPPQGPPPQGYSSADNRV